MTEPKRGPAPLTAAEFDRWFESNAGGKGVRRAFAYVESLRARLSQVEGRAQVAEASVAFERVTVAELRFDLASERAARQAAEAHLRAVPPVAEGPPTKTPKEKRHEDRT
jgi:hypothetical protein